MGRRRRYPGAASALVLVLVGASGCRCGGRRSAAASEEELAEVDETEPAMAARVRAAGTRADAFIDARGDDLDLLARSDARGGGEWAAERAGDRLAAELAAAAGAEVAFVRAGVVRGLSTYKAYGWANALAVDEAEPITEPPPEPWDDVRTYDLHWQTGYIGRYAVGFRLIPIAGAAPLLVGIALHD